MHPRCLLSRLCSRHHLQVKSWPLKHPIAVALTPVALLTRKYSHAGDAASQRLAARLVPRFIAKFQDPELVETAASALIRLSSQQPAPDGTLKALQEHTRQDALQGLGAILKAAQACRTPCAAAVKLILDFVFRYDSHCAALA